MVRAGSSGLRGWKLGLGRNQKALLALDDDDVTSFEGGRPDVHPEHGNAVEDFRLLLQAVSRCCGWRNRRV